MPHKILGDNKHRYNRSVRTGSPGAGSTLSAVEAQLMNMFQQDFLSLIGTFQSVDLVIYTVNFIPLKFSSNINISLVITVMTV